MQNVVLPENLELIGIGCFKDSGVNKIDLPSSVEVIGAQAFKNCDNLVDANLSPALRYLGDEAYYDCDALEKAELSFGLEYLGSLAFAHSEKLKNAYIPATVTSIAGNPFMGCSGVESFMLDPDNSDFVMQDGILYDKTMYTLLYYPASLTAETFQFPQSVHEIGSGAFAGAQLKHLEIPDWIYQIPESAFQGSALESVTFHRGLKSVGDYAFEGCVNLNNVVFLNSIKYGGHYAFANCTSLSNFTFEDVLEGMDPYTIGEHFFDGCISMTEVTLPNSMQMTEEEYSRHFNICHPEAIIPSYMFANTGIVHAVIPAWVMDIATEGIFYNCKKLETVTFESKLVYSEYLGAMFFYGCEKLKEVTIPAGTFMTFAAQNTYEVEPGKDGGYSFAYCTALEKVTLYTDMGWLDTGRYSFYNCPNLKEIEILYVEEFEYDEDENVIGYASVRKDGFGCISTGGFEGCTSLKRVPLTEEIAVYGKVFANTGFETLVFATECLMDEFDCGEVFADAPNLKEVWITGSEWGLSIHEDAFTNLAGELNVYFYEYTYEELVELVGNDAWFKNADKKANFYFKNTIPAGTVIPEGVVLDNETT